ncbi:NAC domain-containing protein 45-like [Triticum aestivum]|uniref:NAC domain-containing protein 45-like n=1 Tax=Triticum aestivum TaxID=4565 RepID=UPI001D01416A|nr:NAC domain-containing protein 45-like [Triticum aestivum]
MTQSNSSTYMHAVDGHGDKERLGFFFVRKQATAYSLVSKKATAYSLVSKKAAAYSNPCFYTTPVGFWKIRGPPSRVKHDGLTVAFKTSMDFYRGRALHGCKTQWSMFEYKLNADREDLRNLARPWMNSYVVCKVRKRDCRRDAKGGEVEAAPAAPSKAKGLWRRPAPLSGSPRGKPNSRRHIGQMDKIVVPKRDVILLDWKQKEAMGAPELEGDEPGLLLGKRKRPATF